MLFLCCFSFHSFQYVDLFYFYSLYYFFFVSVLLVFLFFFISSVLFFASFIVSILFFSFILLHVLLSFQCFVLVWRMVHSPCLIIIIIFLVLCSVLFRDHF